MSFNGRNNLSSLSPRLSTRVDNRIPQISGGNVLNQNKLTLSPTSQKQATNALTHRLPDLPVAENSSSCGCGSAKKEVNDRTPIVLDSADQRSFEQNGSNPGSLSLASLPYIYSNMNESYRPNYEPPSKNRDPSRSRAQSKFASNNGSYSPPRPIPLNQNGSNSVPLSPTSSLYRNQNGSNSVPLSSTSSSYRSQNGSNSAPVPVPLGPSSSFRNNGLNSPPKSIPLSPTSSFRNNGINNGNNNGSYSRPIPVPLSPTRAAAGNNGNNNGSYSRPVPIPLNPTSSSLGTYSFRQNSTLSNTPSSRPVPLNQNFRNNSAPVPLTFNRSSLSPRNSELDFLQPVTIPTKRDGGYNSLPSQRSLSQIANNASTTNTFTNQSLDTTPIVLSNNSTNNSSTLTNNNGFRSKNPQSLPVLSQRIEGRY